MAIDTLYQYIPTYTLPMYTKIAKPRQNDYRVGEVYEMRIEDESRTQHKGQQNPYNYVHEALLVSRQDMRYGDVHPLVIALSGYSQSRSDAESVIQPSGGGWDSDDEVSVLVFMRHDAVKKFIQGDLWINNSFMEKEDFEQ